MILTGESFCPWSGSVNGQLSLSDPTRSSTCQIARPELGKNVIPVDPVPEGVRPILLAELDEEVLLFRGVGHEDAVDHVAILHRLATFMIPSEVIVWTGAHPRKYLHHADIGTGVSA